MYACGTMERTPNFICQVTEASATFNIAIKANLNEQKLQLYHAYAMDATSSTNNNLQLNLQSKQLQHST